MKAPNQTTAEISLLTAAIKDARSGEKDDDQILWRLERGLSSGARAAARTVMGVGAVAVMTLLMALVVVPSDTRVVLAVTALAISGVSSAAVALAWQRDVAMVIRGSGSLRRQSWGGVSEIDLRLCVRVTVTDAGD